MRYSKLCEFLKIVRLNSIVSMIDLTMKSYTHKRKLYINIHYFEDVYPTKKVEFLESTDTVRLVLRFADPFEFND